MGQEFLEVSIPSSYDALGAERLPGAVYGALQKMERQLKKLHDKRRKHSSGGQLQETSAAEE